MKIFLKLFTISVLFLVGIQVEAKEAKVEEGEETVSKQLIIVNKHDNSLTFYDEGYLVKTFKVATGSHASYTPEGEFKVVNRIKNMPYYKTNMPGGHPNNPLGDRWIGWDVPGTAGYTYGMHGTNAEWTIGSYASAGCVRMYNKDIRWLFEKVEEGARVIVLNSDKSADEIATENHYFIYPMKDTFRVFYHFNAILTLDRPNGEAYGVIRPLETLRALSENGNYYQVINQDGEEFWIQKNNFYRDVRFNHFSDIKKWIFHKKA